MALSFSPSATFSLQVEAAWGLDGLVYAVKTLDHELTSEKEILREVQMTRRCPALWTVLPLGMELGPVSTSLLAALQDSSCTTLIF